MAGSFPTSAKLNRGPLRRTGALGPRRRAGRREETPVTPWPFTACRLWPRAVRALSIVATSLIASAPARADDYPNRPVRIIVPTGPGGSYDVVARLVGEQLSARLGHGVVGECE